MISVVDPDHDAARSICWLLSTTGRATRRYRSPTDFLSDYRGDGPGCLVLAHSMPNMSGLELQQHVAARGGRQPFIMLLSRPNHATEAMESIRVGAIDCLIKPFEGSRLIEAVARACAVDADRRKKRAARLAVDGQLATLTPREREVLDFVLDGRNTRDIADRMAISEKTVHVHRSNLARKMRVESVSDVMRIVLGQGDLLDGAG